MPEGLSEGENIKEKPKAGPVAPGLQECCGEVEYSRCWQDGIAQDGVLELRCMSEQDHFCGNWEKDTDFIRLCHQLVYKATPQTVGQ